MVSIRTSDPKPGLAFLLVAALSGGSAWAQQPASAPAQAPSAVAKTADLPAVRDAIAVADVWIREQMSYHDVPGLAVAVVAGSEIVWSAGYGRADLATGEPVTPRTRFRVGSISKLFTATAVLILRDEGRLRLDDPVAKHLPWFAVHNPFPGSPSPTVEQLLTHTSGLPRDTSIPYWTTHVFPTREALRATFPGLPLLSIPGEQYRYSNLGLALAGEVVAAAAGEPWGSFVQRRIMAPLGMSSSLADPPDEELPALAAAYLHKLPDGTRSAVPHYPTLALSPAASVVSTVEDLARFAGFHLAADAGEPPGASVPLAASTRREMQRAHFVYPGWGGGRGLGFGVSRRDERTYVSHGGWIGGHRSDLVLDPARGIAAIAWTNADDAAPSLFSRQLLELVGGAAARATAKAPAAKVADPDWQRFVGRYTDPWGWQYEVLVLGGELVFYEHDYPPDDDADASIRHLTPAGAGRFTMDDGEQVVFETDTKGAVTRVQRRYEYLTPVR